MCSIWVGFIEGDVLFVFLYFRTCCVCIVSMLWLINFEIFGFLFEFEFAGFVFLF